MSNSKQDLAASNDSGKASPVDEQQQDALARGARLRTAREASGLSQVALSEAVGVSGPYINQLERGARVGGLDVWMSVARVLRAPLNMLITGQQDPPSAEGPRDDLLIPVDAEVDDTGTFSGETTVVVHGPKALWRKGPTPNYPLVRVERAGERWFACKVVTTRPINFRAGHGDGTISIDLYPGDLLIMAQAADVPPPTDGSLVHAQVDVGQESQLRVYRIVDGVRFLWPLAPEHGDPVQHRDPWKVAEVAVELRRKL